MKNKEFAEKDVNFIRCCEAAGVEPTKRQASKFRNGKGRAFKSRNIPLEHKSGS